MNSEDRDAWDDRELGAQEEFVAVAEAEVDAALDEACGTTMISIRMPKDMIEWLKLIGERRGGLRYQTLIKNILARFIESEQKLILNEMLAEQLESKESRGSPKKAAG